MNFQSLGNTCVVGLQWGDEGKGKVVDLLTEHFQIVVRYAGGANAGHTVRIGDEKFALHLMPSGILRPNVLNIIGPGVALDPEMLCQEIDALRDRGIKIADNLMISTHAHLVMPYHKKQDLLSEARLGPDRKIGTTAKGIGPCYADKMLRTPAFRAGDLLKPDAFREKLTGITADRNTVFAALYGDREPLDPVAIGDACLSRGASLAPHFSDTTPRLHAALQHNERILFEGAQGNLLDINHGTFPFVTSSTCIAGGVAAVSGIPGSAIHSFVGVMKAYTTRVGSGPFPTELTDATGVLIRERGHEYGTTTGRPRRCGWFDALAVKYAVDLSGITQLAIMHLDTLGTFPEVKICTAYRHKGKILRFFPSDREILEEVEPIYETLPGWGGVDLASLTFDTFPPAARRYIQRLEELLCAPITLISVGAERDATIHRRGGPTIPDGAS